MHFPVLYIHTGDPSTLSESLIYETLDIYSSEYEVEPYPECKVSDTDWESIAHILKIPIKDICDIINKKELTYLDLLIQDNIKDIKEELYTVDIELVDDEFFKVATYNPNVLYDWFSIGGRFKGFLSSKEDNSPHDQLLVEKIDWVKMAQNEQIICNTYGIGFEYILKDDELIYTIEWSNSLDPEDKSSDLYRAIQLLEPGNTAVVLDFHL